MENYFKIFKWENGNKFEDYTQYVVMPIFIEPHLDETLGTGEIILEGVPISKKAEFPPKTKIRIERYTNNTFSGVTKTYDFIVDSDQIEEYVGCPDICCHRIQLIEPSAIAQGMHVDNIALTRELNDVTLNYSTLIPSDEVAELYESTFIDSAEFNRPENQNNASYKDENDNPDTRLAFGKVYSSFENSYYFTNSYRYVLSETSGLENLLKNLNGLVQNEISFNNPMCSCQFFKGVTWEHLFYCPVETVVTRTTEINGVIVSGSEVEVLRHFYNPINIQNRNDFVMYNTGGEVGLCGVTTFFGYKEQTGGGSSMRYCYYLTSYDHVKKFPGIINTNDTNHTSRNITFNTTPLTQTEFDNKKRYLYNISCILKPLYNGSLVTNFKAIVTGYKETTWFLFIPIYEYYSKCEHLNSSYASSYPVQMCNVSFYALDLSQPAPPNPFLVRPRKYSCFDLVRKALLTCDTYIIDNSIKGLDPIYDGEYNDIGIKYPIEISSEWMIRLKEAQLHETIFENKNLWEILLQVGYYLHAIPKLTFNDGDDSFLLAFRQLGDNKTKSNDSTKITIFNSKNLSEYFTQLDSYVKNIFSPQNVIDEWIVAKTTDQSYLVSNDTGELHTKYNISEIVEFDITYNGETLSALKYIFESTIYNVLRSDPGIYPSKGSSLYYALGTNKILGLNYTPPSVNAGDTYYAIKKIVGLLFNVEYESNLDLTPKVKVNELKFHIRYKTQDELRISQFKPNLYDFTKNSKYEKYPHHEQFFGQQDKIVDSERFSANLWGKLIRTANDIYECQEYSRSHNEKEVGDLVNISGELYYVMSVENEYYNDAIFQKVRYSKNFNQISQVVTIPSEPRFYEVSERSMIRREVRIMDFLLISTIRNTHAIAPRFINNMTWKSFIKKLIFKEGGNAILPNFAYTRFKADIKRLHQKENEADTVAISVLYPSTEIRIVDGITQPMPSSDHRDIIVPLLHFPLKNAIIFEWDMDDNFKAGDAIDTSTSGENNTTDKAYYSLQPVRYCDVMGKADLFSFKLFYKDDWTLSQIQRLPFAENNDFIPSDTQSQFLLSDNLSIGLDKDNRESLSFNYQINMLTHQNIAGDGFVIFSNLFGNKNTRLKMIFLKNEVSLFDEVVNLSYDNIIFDNATYQLIDDNLNAIEIRITQPVGINIDEVKAIVLLDVENDLNYACIAKNVGGLLNEDKLKSWWIYPVFNN